MKEKFGFFDKDTCEIISSFILIANINFKDKSNEENEKIEEEEEENEKIEEEENKIMENS